MIAWDPATQASTNNIAGKAAIFLDHFSAMTKKALRYF
jgi:hypothetical protein